jgi:polyisoprenoid-binding protein YceI
MNRRKGLRMAAVSLLLLSLSGASRAALSGPTNSNVSFAATGPAGMKIEGSTPDLQVSDDAGNVVIVVPLANLSTGIGLRDHHMKEKYLEVPKYPSATLTIARSALTFPGGGQQAAADVAGTLQLHGQTRPLTVHYEAKGDGASFSAHGGFHINMNDFGIAVPSYLGVTVKPDVEVNAAFHVTGS